MPDVELQAPDIDDIDETADRYKRWVALLVVSITLFGAVVGYLQTVESNREDRAARDAERQAIVGVGSQVNVSNQFQHEYSVFTEAELLGRQRAIAAGRQRLAATPEESAAFGRAANRFGVVQASLTELSDLLAEADPATGEVDADALFADLQVRADRARLRQAANAELTNDHGGKADAYVAVLTVLAVSLFLIGLSLTVVGRGRRLLVIPGIGLAAACVVWVAFIASRPVAETSEEAIEAVAEGNRLLSRGQPEEAIEEFTRAIELRDDYAAAFGRRADAHFTAGAPDVDGGFVSVTSDEALAAAIEDGKRAVDLGADGDVTVVASLGFNYFLDGRYDDAARLTNQALDLNDSLPFLWLNLGLIELARDDVDQATEYYEIAFELIEDEPDAFTRDVLFAAARTDLDLLGVLEPDLVDLEVEFQERVTGEQMELAFGTADAPEDAAVEIIAFDTDGAFVQADYEAIDVPDDAPIAFVWFHRQDRDLPFVQPQSMAELTTIATDRDLGFEGTHFKARGVCQVPGEYRLDIYVGDRRAASDSFLVEEPVLGTFVETADQTAGVSLCHPEDWTRIESEDPNQVMVAPEDQTGLIIAQTLGVPADFGVAGDELLDTAIAAAIEGQTLISGPEFARVAGDDGRIAIAETPDGRVAVAAMHASDRSIGVVVMGTDDPDELEALVAEVLPTLRFETL